MIEERAHTAMLNGHEFCYLDSGDGPAVLFRDLFVGTDGMEHNLFCEDHTRFHPLAIDSRKLAARDWSYRPASPKFEFTQEGLPPFRKRAFERIIQLAREHRIPVINIQMPNKRALAGATVKADAYWPDYFGYPIEMIGIPPSDYFQGLDEKQIHCLFWEIDHPNRNGALYFTKSIAPTLVKAYGRSAQTH